MPETETIGERLRSARRARQMSLHIVAEKLGVSVATLSRIETNKQSIDLPFFVRLAHAIGINPATLIEDSSARDGDGLVRQLAALRPAERADVFAAAVKGAHHGRGTADLHQRLDGLVTSLDVLRHELLELRRDVKKRR